MSNWPIPIRHKKSHENKLYKIVVVGLGYVGLSNAVLLAQHNEVIGVDISQERVDLLNARKSSNIDTELSQYLEEKDLNLSASADLKASITNAVREVLGWVTTKYQIQKMNLYAMYFMEIYPTRINALLFVDELFLR